MRLAAEAWRNLGAFSAAYEFVLRDLARFSKRRVAAVVVLNLLGVTLQWAVVAGALLFVGELTGEGGAFNAPLLGGLDLEADASFASVSLWALVVLVLVAGAAGSAYAAEALGFDTARRYVESSGREILSATLAARQGEGGAGEPPARRLQRVLGRDQMMMLRALVMLQRSLRSVLMATVAVVVLALINVVLTAVVAAVATLFVVPYYLINRRVVAAAVAAESDRARARAAIGRLVDHATAREATAGTARAVPETYVADPALGGRWTNLREIMMGRQRTTAVMTALLGTCLVAIVVAFGLFIARDDASWVAALTFLVAINVASGAFIQLAGAITGANRFLPHIQHLIAFRRQLERDGAAGATEVEGELPAVTVRPTLPGSERELPLRAGTRILCVVPHPVDRLNLHTVLARLAGGSVEHARRLRAAAFFHGDPSTLPPVPAHVLLGERGAAILAELGLWDEVERLPDGEATVLTSELQERMSSFLRYALGMVEGIGHELVVLGWSSFSRLSQKERSRLLAFLEQQPVLFVTTLPPRSQPAEATHTAVLTDDGVSGMGAAAWYDAIAPDLRTAGRELRPVADGSLDDLEEDL